VEIEEPIVLAVWPGNRSSAEAFFARELDSDSTSRYVSTLLQLAIAQGWGSAVSLLRDQGVDLSKLGVRPQVCPLNLAIDLSHERMVRRDLDSGAAATTKPEQERSSPTLVALAKGREAMVPTLIEHGALPDGKTSLIRLLWTAILYSPPSGLKYAFCSGVNPKYYPWRHCWNSDCSPLGNGHMDSSARKA
jgi:hypothetical protein